MCGINGIIGVEGLDDPKNTVAIMNDALAHRGPDASGIFTTNDVVLGHRRLAIIDLSEAAEQPFYSHDRQQVVVFNGEIYNYRELRAQLADYPFTTSSDTEVLIAAYRAWGNDFVNALNGMFAFALWDEQTQSLIIARDRLGIKPLYYTRQGSGVAFSSELRPLLAAGLANRQLCREGLHDYLRYQTVHAPKTIIEGVSMLEPGHRFIISDSEFIHEPWYDLAKSVSPVVDSRETIVRNIRDLLTSSVELRMRADVDFGAFLSGGIDSSAVVGLMSEVSERPVSTFNVSFEESEFSESAYARLIAKRFNTKHIEIVLTPDHFLGLLPEALEAMDHPSGDGPNTYIVSKVTREEGIKMALSGLGGDELFAGYAIFKQATAMLDKRWLQSFPMLLRRLAGFTLQQVKPSIGSWKTAAIITQDYLDLEHAYPFSRLTLADQWVSKLLTDQRKVPNSVRMHLRRALDVKGAAFGLPYLSQVSYAEITTYLQNVLLRDTDQMSMAHALEVRVPFLDHRLVNYTLGVPDPVKYPHTPKKLLTDALGDLLPVEIIDRPKMGFTLPWEHWMKNELRNFCEAALVHLGNNDAFQARGLNALWNRFLKNDPLVSWSRIWHLVVLSDWMKRNGL
jgi:asparagine synthase (glutamine-hydrolysing)